MSNVLSTKNDFKLASDQQAIFEDIFIDLQLFCSCVVVSSCRRTSVTKEIFDVVLKPFTGVIYVFKGSIQALNKK